MKILKLVFQFVLLGIALVSILPHLLPNFWFTDIFSHFKLQYVIILMFLLLPAALFPAKKRIFQIVLILILIMWNSWFIVPLYMQDKVMMENSGEPVSILSMNLLASNYNYNKALDLIREKDPDIVVFQELSLQWEAQLQDLYLHYPFRQMHPQNNNFGIGILSKFPMNSEVTNFGKGFPPSVLGEIKVDRELLTILATHPFPPVGQDRFEYRNEQLEEIAQLSNKQSGNFIVAGDLNTSSYSFHFGELLKNGNLYDSRKGFGIASTWPADYLIMRTTLDHILYKGNIQVLTRKTENSIGSDHLPVYLHIVI